MTLGEDCARRRGTVRFYTMRNREMKCGKAKLAKGFSDNRLSTGRTFDTYA